MLHVFRNKPKYATVRPEKANQDGVENGGSAGKGNDPQWTRCDNCSSLIYNKELHKNNYVCHHCGFYFRMSAVQRLQQLADENTFQPFEPLVSCNPLDFPGYPAKITQCQNATQLDDAILIGEAKIEGYGCVLGIIDFGFIGGSMGSVVGEQITRGFEYGIAKQLPVVIVSGGGGGARMQEGIFSLMQMAKTAQAVGRFKKAGLFYLSVLTHPTMGGIYASFASLGDIILAEPKALIGFAGPRIVAETTRQKLPPDFQTAEYALKHGMIDGIVIRSEMKATISKLLSYHL
ncbi:MAG: acetyl-CoA carboxylase, carboxyltransferase subunit beta [Limnochordia bacterium]|jgi:acetyl-CoA carboxylase carboxyl transferase subunit beta|nr:acetyl-CoA carboxylase, carboxyltransferase subunit beta [Bacillota bacterium]NLH31393.1 acetyl-CoA carboxylase, carboxyltransferase subunit beta [Bacillota bacterium]HOB09363.1 acetyl-CoA carboxylase, carboxyltransferase subunit beta [Limnochordia bacterium]HPZ30459.1 acetyl-CoA carboxylase, carboxyltransferase subunit beta [Limnochordia bacterium]HQD70765.1 acetyl-CoA carboxylase, carboxyltransferase subunit beta [Limnochordia bacterium]